MKAIAKVIAALLIALAPEVLAHGQPRDRGEGQRLAPPPRPAPRRAPEPRPGYGAPAPPYGYQPYAPRPAPPAYAGGYAPSSGPAPRYAAPPAYRPDSLGPDWSQQQDQARQGVREGRLMALRDVTSMIRTRIPGSVLDAGIEPGPDGRPAYRVRWAAKGGRRIDFIVDAATGAIISRSGG